MSRPSNKCRSPSSKRLSGNSLAKISMLLTPRTFLEELACISIGLKPRRPRHVNNFGHISNNHFVFWGLLFMFAYSFVCLFDISFFFFGGGGCFLGHTLWCGFGMILRHACHAQPLPSFLRMQFFFCLGVFCLQLEPFH